MVERAVPGSGGKAMGMRVHIHPPPNINLGDELGGWELRRVVLFGEGGSHFWIFDLLC